MSQTCEYCDEQYDGDGYYKILSHGFGRGNKEWKAFCSVVCRTWWRRRCSDDSGAWEQPAPKGYQALLDEYVADDTDADESAAQHATIAASEAATVEADA